MKMFEPFTEKGLEAARALRAELVSLCGEESVSLISPWRTLAIRRAPYHCVQVDFSPDGKIIRVHATLYDADSKKRKTQPGLKRLIKKLIES